MSAIFQLMPALSPAERADLKESIRRYGVLVPVEKDENGDTMDGHNRVELWEELREEGEQLPDYPVIIRTGLSEPEKRTHVRALNLARRHLSAKQRRELIADELRDEPSQSNAQVAERLGVDDKTVASVRRDLQSTSEFPRLEKTIGRDGKARPAVFCRTSAGAGRVVRALPSIPVEAMPTGIIGEYRLGRLAAENRHSAATGTPSTDVPGVDIRHGDFLDVLADLPDNSVDLIFTDPPYGAVSEIDRLGKFAERILRPGGFLVSYFGVNFLPEFLAGMRRHLEYVWTIALAHRDRGNLIHKTRMRSQWKPILVFAKTPWNRPGEDWIDDLLQGAGREKHEHHWQQAEEEAVSLIEAFSVPGAIVIDPFVGSATTGIAAMRSKRRFIGCDIDAAAVATAVARFSSKPPGEQRIQVSPSCNA